jgi:hypothetical protein
MHQFIGQIDFPPIPLSSHFVGEPTKLLFGHLKFPEVLQFAPNLPSGASTMPSPKSNRTTRRLLKLASLGIAGLLAGLFSGCSSTPTSSTVATYTPTSTWRLNSSGFTYRRKSLDTRPIPDLRRPPAPHHIESWADRTPHQQVVASQFDPGPTLTNYDFTGDRLSASSASAHLAIQ